MKSRFLALAGILTVAAGLIASTETVRLPMKDGVPLATDVHLPDGPGPFPVIFIRTTYNRVMGLGLAPQANKRGYAFVVQDTRGRFGSKGDNLAFDADGLGEHQDGLETIEWIAKQKWCNGKIGTWGGSALAITTLQLAATGTTNLTAQHFTVGSPSLYKVIYTGGVFRKALAEDWLNGSKFAPEALTVWTSHPAYDSYWKARDLTGRYDKVNAPAVHIGGWYDIFAQGTIDAFNGYQKQGGPGARGKQKLIMGPWTHGVFQEKAGDLKFPNAGNPPTKKLNDYYAWFDHWLKGEENGIDKLPAVTYYVMGDTKDAGAPGNTWRTGGEWPPPESKATPFFFHADKSLSRTAPKREQALTYTYDPADPAPTVGGVELTIPAGALNQEKVESRPDVLVFSTEPLAEPVEVTGHVLLNLWISSDSKDTDFMGKLCDVYPDGTSYNICEGALRARFREGFTEEKLLTPGKIYPVQVDLWSTSIIFNKGHRIRVQVTSSSDRGYDPNPNTGEKFRSSDRKLVAHNTIYVDSAHPSQIVLPLMPSPKPVSASSK